MEMSGGLLCGVLQRAPAEGGPVSTAYLQQICPFAGWWLMARSVLTSILVFHVISCPLRAGFVTLYFLISRIYESKDGGVWRLSQIVRKESQERVCNCISHLQTWFHSSPYVAPVTTNKALVSQIGATLGTLIFLGFLLYSLHSICVTTCYFPDYVFVLLTR